MNYAYIPDSNYLEVRINETKFAEVISSHPEVMTFIGHVPSLEDENLICVEFETEDASLISQILEELRVTYKDVQVLSVVTPLNPQ